MSSETLNQLLSGFANARVLCIGDMMLDRFIYGAVNRISPESPVPIFSYSHEEVMLGGAGNVVRNIGSLGGAAHFISVIGDDATGKTLTRLVGEAPALEPYLVTETRRVSTEKTRYVSSSQQLLRADRETTQPISISTQDKLLEIANTEMARIDVLILSDYGKGVLTREAVKALIKLAKKYNKPVLVDPKQRDFSYYAGATILSPNVKELCEAAGLELAAANDIEALAHAAKQLCAAHDLGCLLVTRGKDGMMLCDKSGLIDQVKVSQHEVFDVSGAGDTSLAALSLAIAIGADAKDAMALANFAAGIAVTKLGTATVHHEELAQAISDASAQPNQTKVVSRIQANEIISKWRAKGRKIGFTNGCFDIMHAGHVSLLSDAKARCDKLVIGVNTDASVQRLKGPSRPVNKEQDRAQLLASLSMIDLVVLFDEDTPVELIELFKPDVLMKGADYTLEQVVGHEIVQAYGGKVELIPLKDGYSTTNIIEKASSGNAA